MKKVKILIILISIGIIALVGYRAFSNDKAPNRLPEAKVKEIYSAIAGEGKYTINGPRATFIENGVKWTIVGANAPIVNPTVYPKEWPVKGDNFEIFVIPEPITNYKILPFTDPIENAIKTDTISITAAKGEYEPASFVICSGDKELKNVMIEVSDLKANIKDKNGNIKTAIIPKENIDIRVVKCWYQAGVEIDDVNHKTLTPELLLHDDDLVRVDYERQVNIIKNFDSIEDAETLKPFTIPKRQNKQIWFTVYIPIETLAGIYYGTVKVFTPDLQQKIKIKLVVLPFVLPEPLLDYSIYYVSRLSPNYKGVPTGRYKNEIQMFWELKDMVAHGIDNPTIFMEKEDCSDINLCMTTLQKIIDLRKKAGISLKKPLLIVYDWQGVFKWKENMAYYRDLIEKFVQIANTNGISDIYIHAKDEAIDKEIIEGSSVLDMIHKTGAKVFTSGWITELLKHSDHFDIFVVNGMWGYDKIAIYSSGPTIERVLKAKQLGKKVWIYGNPQGGLELPETYRRNYGFQLWLRELDGACTFAYQGGHYPWDDFSPSIYITNFRPHNMVYPTMSKPIPTLQWEGWREGVDDVRYLTLLIKKKVDERELKKIIGDNDNPYKIRKIIIERLLGK